jgi:DNA-binding NtrC family response regulator
VARYLIVDDSETIRMGLKSAIKTAQKSAETMEATNPAQALKLFKASPFDAVFLDLVLDEAGDGIQLMDDLLKNKPGTIVILTTGLERSHPDVIKGISQGAFAHLLKPVRVSDMSRVLAEVEDEQMRRA